MEHATMTDAHPEPMTTITTSLSMQMKTFIRDAACVPAPFGSFRDFDGHQVWLAMMGDAQAICLAQDWAYEDLGEDVVSAVGAVGDAGGVEEDLFACARCGRRGEGVFKLVPRRARWGHWY